MSILRSLFVLSLFLLGVGVGPRPQNEDEPPAPEPVWVFLVRHAEKAADGGRDPDLAPAGEQRAQALARLLAPAGVTHLFCSEYRRTRATLAPLAKALELEPSVVGAREVLQLAQRLRDLPAGSVAVVVGHSNTVPALAAALGRPLSGLEDSPQGPIFPETEYGRLIQLILHGQGASHGIELALGS